MACFSYAFIVILRKKDMQLSLFGHVQVRFFSVVLLSVLSQVHTFKPDLRSICKSPNSPTGWAVIRGKIGRWSVQSLCVNCWRTVLFWYLSWKSCIAELNAVLCAPEFCNIKFLYSCVVRVLIYSVTIISK